MKRKKTWLSGVLSVVAVLVALADTGLMGRDAQRVVGPALDAVRPVAAVEAKPFVS